MPCRSARHEVWRQQTGACCSGQQEPWEWGTHHGCTHHSRCHAAHRKPQLGHNTMTGAVICVHLAVVLQHVPVHCIHTSCMACPWPTPCSTVPPVVEGQLDRQHQWTLVSIHFQTDCPSQEASQTSLQHPAMQWPIWQQPQCVTPTCARTP